MGTRSITTIRSSWDEESELETHAVIYRHWDGYLEGHGEWLLEFLQGARVVNGKRGDEGPMTFNGPGRLAAGIVSKLLLDGHEPDLRHEHGDCGQEFEYVVDVQNYGQDKAVILVTVFDGPVTAFGMGGEKCNNKIFSGTVEEYAAFLGLGGTPTNQP
jgi:hypothetical protein